ncbi:phage replisome organizer N-terminal domain-containing protein [Clostridium beijerinckii]|uniref:phage replisome organizer N-terminal domain-containing protein n=1 Tax=Clostridium beijerinckii TaxID=1520 RepID=UPI000316A4AC|nr:phage replisome organizer N-terminal domain-containing protein [Clostridium beijerinckii]
MSDIKWIKLATCMPDDEKMKLIDAMPERDTIHYLWIRLLIQAGKTNANGLIYLNENIPYTDEMLSTLFCRPLASIRLALKVLCAFQMIEIADNNVIKIVNWERHQNVEGMDRVRDQNRKRVQNHREKKKQLEAATGESEETSIEIENNECDITKDSCNATESKSNVTVTEQNKRETKNKKEIKNENRKDREKVNTCDEKKDLNFEKSESVKSSVSQSKDSIAEQGKNLENINTKCVELVKFCETITGIPNVLNLGALKLAISMHGHQYVKMAIDIALKANKPNMTYIDGILKNWRREGYPDDKEVKKNVNRSYGKNSNPDKNEFAGFKPKKSRSLTEEQRKKAEETLI